MCIRDSAWILENGFAGLVVATKADKLSKNQRHKAFTTIKKALNVPYDDLIVPYSAVTKENVDELWEILEDMAAYYKNKD